MFFFYLTVTATHIQPNYSHAPPAYGVAPGYQPTYNYQPNYQCAPAYTGAYPPPPAYPQDSGNSYPPTAPPNILAQSRNNVCL